MSKRRCRDCAHVQPCGIYPQHKEAWDRTFHHLEERQGEDAFLHKQMEMLAEYCRHFEVATKPQKVLPVNSRRRP